MSHDHRIKYNAMFDFECLPYIKLRGDSKALVGGWARWAMAHPLFKNLLNNGPFKIFFQKHH